MTGKLPNVHPGEVQSRPAREISGPPCRINETVLGQRDLDSDAALRLARYFGTSERFWLGLQVEFEGLGEDH